MIYLRPAARQWRCPPASTSAAAFHRTLPGHRATELTELPELADELGVGRVFVKDESTRLGLPAFKALGASWGIHRALTDRVLGTGAPGPGSFDGLRGLAASAPRTVLVSATDGNHGRAVARFARLLGLESKIVVPRGVGAAAVAAIRGEGADVTLLDADYDASVAAAAGTAAADPAALLVQDTGWPGYEAVPAAIVEGYSTLFGEVDEQLAAARAAGPDVIVVPVGVGSLAHAAVVHARSGSSAPVVLAVEPETAACALASLRADTPVTVATGWTSMAGLNCGTVSASAWPSLRAGLDAAVAVAEEQVAVAVADLARLGVSSGPCGAATLAGVRAIGAQRLGLGPAAVVVLLSTEGHTTTAAVASSA